MTPDALLLRCALLLRHLPRKSPLRQRWVALSLSLLCVGWGMNCTRGQSGRNPVVGVITPEYFRFRETVPDDDEQEPGGGWRAVRIHALIKHGDSGA